MLRKLYYVNKVFNDRNIFINILNIFMIKWRKIILGIISKKKICEILCFKGKVIFKLKYICKLFMYVGDKICVLIVWVFICFWVIYYFKVYFVVNICVGVCNMV